MKQIVLIRYILFLTVLVTTVVIPIRIVYFVPQVYATSQADTNVQVPVDLRITQSPDEEIYREIIYTFLEPCVEEVLADYYPPPIKYDRRDVKILSIERPNGRGTFYFRFKLMVSQYIGPYDKIGIDYLTLETAPGSRLRALEYKHTEGFDFHRKIQREPIMLKKQESTPQWPENTGSDGLYRDIAIRLLSPYIDEAIKDYYGQSFTHDPWSDQVMKLTRLKAKDRLFYIIKLKVIPYTGPHNSVGVDNITLSINTGPEVRNEKFEHLETHEWPFKPNSSSQGLKVKQALAYINRLFFSLKQEAYPKIKNEIPERSN